MSDASTRFAAAVVCIVRTVHVSVVRQNIKQSMINFALLLSDLLSLIFHSCLVRLPIGIISSKAIVKKIDSLRKTLLSPLVGKEFQWCYLPLQSKETAVALGNAGSGFFQYTVCLLWFLDLEYQPLKGVAFGIPGRVIIGEARFLPFPIFSRRRNVGGTLKEITVLLLAARNVHASMFVLWLINLNHNEKVTIAFHSLWPGQTSILTMPYLYMDNTPVTGK